MNNANTNNKFSSQNRIIFSFLATFFIAILIICMLMYQVFSNNLSENLHSRATEVIDIIDYMAQTSGESPALTKGIKTLAASRDIKLIVVRINEPPTVIASNKEALIGSSANKTFSKIEKTKPFKFDEDTDQYTAISSIWLENNFSDRKFTKATVGIIFDTYKTRTLLQKQILDTSLYLILTTIFVLGLAYILTNRYIFKPLEIINSSLNSNDSNNEFIPIPLARNDEIGAVASTLNQLFSDLYSSKKKLRENTERYDLALQGTKVGLVDWDVIANKVYCSSSLKEILGINKSDFSPDMEWIENRTHKEDREMAHAALVAHLKDDIEYDVEGRLKHHNGEYIWMRARGQAVRDHSGRAIRMVGYYVDISKRKANEKFMNSLYLLSIDASLPLAHKINYILKEGLNYLGLECGLICKIEGESSSVSYYQCPDSYHINNQSTFNLNDTFCKHTVEENSMVAAHNISKSNLNYLPEHTDLGIKCYIGIPLYLHGRIYGTVSFTDYQARPELFSEREKSFVRLISQWISNEMMRAQYIDYLHETESRLEEAVEELTDINSELESFTHVASHDLQEPLRMITNFTGLLEKNYADILDNTATEYLNILSKSAKQMRVLIKDLLEYAHASKENEKVDTLDLNSLLKQVLNNLDKQIRESKAVVKNDNLPIIQANKASMISLLQNIINNGIKFQHANKHPIIEIKAFQHTGSWVIAVNDNGIGIDSNYHTKIFEPFKRLHAKSEYKGTGIGLAVCKKIISRMNGKMWIESEKDVGTTFYFSIPNQITETGKAA